MVDELELLQLVELAQSGDRQAFGVLARQFESTIFAIACGDCEIGLKLPS